MGEVIIIVAIANNNVIGNGNDLPWHLPSDLKHFKETTNGHTVVMGRKCYKSIPEKFRPLPNRKNVIITRNKEYKQDGAVVVHSINEAMSFAKEGDVYVIGGAQIYNEFFNEADKLILTKIVEDVEGDTYLDLDLSEWTMVDESDMVTENGLTFTIQTYI